jgi:PAS domain S-box-containing protein
LLLFAKGAFTLTTISNNSLSQQNQEAQAFRLLMENVTDYAIFFLDINRYVTRWNIGAERILGYQEAEIIDQSADLIFTPEDRHNREPEKEMQQALEDGRAIDERWHLRKDGSSFLATGILTRLTDEEGILQGYAKILRDLTERQQAQESLRRSNQEMEERVKQRTGVLESETIQHQQAKEHSEFFLKILVTAQEDERKRIARDLHDQIGQQVTALRLKMENLKARCAQQTELCEGIAQVQELIIRLDNDIDFLAWELRPANLEQFGLPVTLDNYVQEWSHNFRTAAEFHYIGKEGQRFAPEVETNLYRIVQEALNNTAKHASARKVSVLLEHLKGEIRLLIEDDGRGFDVQSVGVRKDGKGLGLVGIKERALYIGDDAEIESSPGAGTTIIVRLPSNSPESL